MGQRLDLQTLLENLAGEAYKVYFQPPAGTSMQYPCIVYKRDDAETIYADNNPYHHTKRYMVTVIDRKPESAVLDSIASLPMCRFDRFYTADGLNHDVYNLYF